jgi:hypothetical protein
VIWALSQVNFAFDRSTEPHVTHDELADAFGLSKSTLSQKAKQVRDILKMSWMTPEYLRESRVDANTLIWWVEVNGLPYDARALPFELQVEAYAKGLIPYVPDLGRDGTAESIVFVKMPKP